MRAAVDQEVAPKAHWRVLVDQAEVVLSLRGQLGRDPELRRRAQALGLPILVIKSDSLHQLHRAIQRLIGTGSARWVSAKCCFMKSMAGCTDWPGGC
jgi:hypothetical protein